MPRLSAVDQAFFLLETRISITNPIVGITQSPLLQTTPNSRGEVNFTYAGGTQISQDPEVLLGPLTMAASGENTNTKGRVVVFGNAIFVNDQGFDAYGNGNIFVNSVDWAAEQEGLLDLTTRTATQRTYVPPTQGSFLILVIIAIIVIPGMVVFSGVSSWLARRKRG